MRVLLHALKFLSAVWISYCWYQAHISFSKKGRGDVLLTLQVPATANYKPDCELVVLVIRKPYVDAVNFSSW